MKFRSKPGSNRRRNSALRAVSPTVADQTVRCQKCGLPLAICACASALAPPLTQTATLFQHPAEAKRLLSTIAWLRVSTTALTIHEGIRFAPTLEKTLGKAVLFFPDARFKHEKLAPGFYETDAEGRPKNVTAESLKYKNWIFIDGTWAEAKTILFTNPWLQRLPRVHFVPEEPSAYRGIRNEMQKDFRATAQIYVEAAARVQKISAADLLKPLIGWLEKLKA